MEAESRLSSLLLTLSVLCKSDTESPIETLEIINYKDNVNERFSKEKPVRFVSIVTFSCWNSNGTDSEAVSTIRTFTFIQFKMKTSNFVVRVLSTFR